MKDNGYYRVTIFIFRVSMCLLSANIAAPARCDRFRSTFRSLGVRPLWITFAAGDRRIAPFQQVTSGV